MQLVLNTETIKSTRPDNLVTIGYDQLNPYFNTTTRTIQYQRKSIRRTMLADGERNKECRALRYTVKTDYVTAGQSVWEHMLLKTPFGQPKGISYASPARYEDAEDRELNNCKEIRIANIDKLASLTVGAPPTIQKVITYGVLNLLSDIGGLVKVWALTLGSLSSFLLHRILNKELKVKNIKETLSFNNIKQVTDDVNDLKTESAVNKERIDDIENQLNETSEV